MYIPNLFRETDTERMFDFMKQHAFATVISVVEGAPAATHMPLSVSRLGDGLILRGHFAKANPHWQGLEYSETLIVFTGPHAYVSAKYYERFESVPTWNYLAVHAHGQARLVEAEESLAGLHELIDQNDPTYRSQWDSLSERYRNGMLTGIVGFEMPVARLDGKRKLSQNKTTAERARIAEALAGSADPAARDTGQEMTRELRVAADSE